MSLPMIFGKLRFSRSGATSPLGKLTEQIPAIRIPGETKALLEQQSRLAGLPLQEYVRELLLIRAHGLSTVQSMYSARAEVVSGKSDQSLSLKSGTHDARP